MEDADRTRYEQQHPSHPTEKEFFDRVIRRMDEALRQVAETEKRMTRDTRNTGRDGTPRR